MVSSGAGETAEILEKPSTYKTRLSLDTSTKHYVCLFTLLHTTAKIAMRRRNFLWQARGRPGTPDIQEGDMSVIS
jgi:hypothetical protein